MLPFAVIAQYSASASYGFSMKVDRGLEYSHLCADLEDRRFMAKTYVSLGVGYSLKADEAKLQVQRQEHQKQALNLFLR